jgi:hypothetical protein
MCGVWVCEKHKINYHSMKADALMKLCNEGRKQDEPQQQHQQQQTQQHHQQVQQPHQ